MDDELAEEFSPAKILPEGSNDFLSTDSNWNDIRKRNNKTGFKPSLNISNTTKV